MYQNETTAEQELVLLMAEACSSEKIPNSLLDSIEHYLFVVRNERALNDGSGTER